MSIIRDYGLIGGAGYTGASTDTNNHGLVFLDTHYGEQRLPYMNRSFISFTYSNPDESLVYIEDFNLIVVFSNSRFEREGYTPFNDLTTTYDNLDGQYYWGTHYKSQTITFLLATDGIDLRTLERFLHWFSAGVCRELILSEHPNRARMARVAEPPQLSLLPFESLTTMIISGIERPVTTTLYKGDITLKLVMDEPHWYAKDNILGTLVTETDPVTNKKKTYYIDEWRDTTKNPPQQVEIFASADALKILYEDGIPLGSMIDNNMLLGNGAFANVEKNIEALIWSLPKALIVWTDGIPSGEGARIDGTITDTMFAQRSREYLGTEDNSLLSDESNEYIKTDLPEDFVADYRESIAGKYVGVIAGAIVNADGQGIIELANINNNGIGYFFYSGTAPSPTILQFNFIPMNADSITYINTPSNKFVNTNIPYSTITIGSLTILELHFTTPNILTSYNTVIKIINTDCGASESYENIRKHIREQTHHLEVRQWAIKVIDYAEALEITSAAELCLYMSYFLKDNYLNVYTIKCQFNSENGECYGWFHYRQVNNSVPANDQEWINYGNIPADDDEATLKKEDIGDMIRSNYLMIKDRNYPTSNGRIVKWEQDHPEYSHYIYHDFALPLTNLSITYKNMYL